MYKIRYMGTNTSGASETQTALDAIRRIVHALRASSRWSERHVGLSGAQLFVTLSLSPRGRRAAGRSPDVPQGRLIQAIEGLSATRRRQLAAALTEVATAMDVVERPPAMFFEEQARARRRAAHV